MGKNSRLINYCMPLSIKKAYSEDEVVHPWFRHAMAVVRTVVRCCSWVVDSLGAWLELDVRATYSQCLIDYHAAGPSAFKKLLGCPVQGIWTFRSWLLYPLLLCMLCCNYHRKAHPGFPKESAHLLHIKGSSFMDCCMAYSISVQNGRQIHRLHFCHCH